MGILDIFQVSNLKAELKRVTKQRDQLKAAMSDVQRMEAYGLKKAIEKLLARKQLTLQEIANAEAEVVKQRNAVSQQLSDLNRQIAKKQQEIVVLDEETLLQSFGFYEPKYELASSELYKVRLDQIHTQQAKMIKDGSAAHVGKSWSVNDSQKEGERMAKDYVKLILRSFNNEFDASIVNIKFNNVTSIEKKIQKAFETLNKLGERMTISISREYLNLKIQELYLCYEYQVKKQQEKDEQKRIREQMREESKALKEIEEMKQKLEKEEKHFAKALHTLSEQLQRATTEAEREILEVEKTKIEQKLGEVAKDMLTVEKREQNTRAGYVYVISNVGAFGEHVYKIGVTRRLEPQERVDELGDASVPFEFDVHALIFSEDAPALEHALHKAFENHRVNRINRRREFFHVTLDEIETVVKTHFEKPVDFIRLADAPEYRQSLMLKNNLPVSISASVSAFQATA